MMYEPRKVFVLENNNYKELTYSEFCYRKKTDSLYSKKLFIPVQGYLLETDRTHYKAFYQEKERYRYIRKLDTENDLLSIDAFDNEDGNGIEGISIYEEDIADLVADKIMAEHLRNCLSLLLEDERDLIYEIYYNNLTERELAEKYKISQAAVHKRKHRILIKLKNLVEI